MTVSMLVTTTRTRTTTTKAISTMTSTSTTTTTTVMKQSYQSCGGGGSGGGGSTSAASKQKDKKKKKVKKKKSRISKNDRKTRGGGGNRRGGRCSFSTSCSSCSCSNDNDNDVRGGSTISLVISSKDCYPPPPPPPPPLPISPNESDEDESDEDESDEDDQYECQYFSGSWENDDSDAFHDTADFFSRQQFPDEQQKRQFQQRRHSEQQRKHEQGHLNNNTNVEKRIHPSERSVKDDSDANPSREVEERRDEEFPPNCSKNHPSLASAPADGAAVEDHEDGKDHLRHPPPTTTTQEEEEESWDHGLKVTSGTCRRSPSPIMMMKRRSVDTSALSLNTATTGAPSEYTGDHEELVIRILGPDDDDDDEEEDFACRHRRDDRMGFFKTVDSSSSLFATAAPLPPLRCDEKYPSDEKDLDSFKKADDSRLESVWAKRQLFARQQQRKTRELWGPSCSYAIDPLGVCDGTIPPSSDWRGEDHHEEGSCSKYDSSVYSSVVSASSSKVSKKKKNKKNKKKKGKKKTDKKTTTTTATTTTTTTTKTQTTMTHSDIMDGKMRYREEFQRSGEMIKSAFLSSTASASCPHHRWRRKSVKFGSISVREHERVLEVNPSCSHGPPIGLGWRHGPERVFDVESYERAKSTLWAPRDFLLPRDIRERMLLQRGYTQKQLAQAVRTLTKSKNQRKATVINSHQGFAKIEEMAESAKRAFFAGFGGVGREKELDLEVYKAQGFWPAAA